jgi:hypothetical protein
MQRNEMTLKNQIDGHLNNMTLTICVVMNHLAVCIICCGTNILKKNILQILD